MKAFRSLELGSSGSLIGQPGTRPTDDPATEEDEGALQRELSIPNDRRMWAIFRALERGWSVEHLHELTKIDPWFLTQFSQIVELCRSASLVGLRGMSTDLLRTLKRAGLSDQDLGTILGTDDEAIRGLRAENGLMLGLQADRYLRGGVRVVHALSLRHVREGVRGRPDAAAQGRHPRERPEPDRAGPRVRLLLLSRGVRAARRRLRNGHDQLQSRDRVDRLRHRRSALLRAADVRGRVGDHRARGAGAAAKSRASCNTAGRRR